MKKIFKGLIAFIVTSLGILSLINVSADSGWWNANDNGYGSGKKAHVEGVRTIGTSDADNTNASILDTIQRAINRVLGMLSFVALILCLWGGFQMLTAGGDDSKVKSGTKVLKNAGIGLAVIGLSWLVVSFVFRIVNKTSGATP